MKQHELIEHYLVPTALIVFNACLFHFVYILSIEGLFTGQSCLMLLAVLLFICSFYTKKKWAFILSTLFYLFLLLIKF